MVLFVYVELAAFLFFVAGCIGTTFIIYKCHTNSYSLSPIVVLNTRFTFILPSFGFLFLIGVIEPDAIDILEIFQATIEGYILYAFLMWLITNMGGQKRTIEYIDENPKPIKLRCFNLGDTAEIFFNRTAWGVFHVLSIRPAVMLFVAICSQSTTYAAVIVLNLLQLVAFVIITRGLIYLLALYFIVGDHCANLNAAYKFLALKGLIGFIIIEKIVANFLYTTGKSPFKGDNTYNEKEQTLQAFCVLALIEIAFMSPIFYFIFTVKMTEPVESLGPPGVKPTYWQFLLMVLSLHDIFGLVNTSGTKINQVADEAPDADAHVKQSIVDKGPKSLNL